MPRTLAECALVVATLVIPAIISILSIAFAFLGSAAPTATPSLPTTDLASTEEEVISYTLSLKTRLWSALPGVVRIAVTVAGFFKSSMGIKATDALLHNDVMKHQASELRMSADDIATPLHKEGAVSFQEGRFRTSTRYLCDTEDPFPSGAIVVVDPLLMKAFRFMQRVGFLSRDWHVQPQETEIRFRSITVGERTKVYQQSPEPYWKLTIRLFVFHVLPAISYLDVFHETSALLGKTAWGMGLFLCAIELQYLLVVIPLALWMDPRFLLFDPIGEISNGDWQNTALFFLSPLSFAAFVIARGWECLGMNLLWPEVGATVIGLLMFGILVNDMFSADAGVDPSVYIPLSFATLWVAMGFPAVMSMACSRSTVSLIKGPFLAIAALMMMILRNVCLGMFALKDVEMGM